MIRQKRPEVHLEVCGGFFRIPTEKIVYNITVLDSPKIGADSVPAAMSSFEKSESQMESTEAFVDGGGEIDQNILPAVDNYYKEAAIYYSGELSSLFAGEEEIGQDESLADTSVAVWEEVLVKLDQTVAAVENGKVILKDIQAPLRNEEEQSGLSEQTETSTPFSEKIGDVQIITSKLKKIITEFAEKNKTQTAIQVEPPPPAKKTIKKVRYLFDLDTVFQTIYELCTNETVKEHSQKARAAASEIFNLDGFLDYISERIGTYSEVDGFFSVPLTDVLIGLAEVCSNNKTANLLKNMNKNQADIFLDQFLPLEVPPKEEIEVTEEAGETEDLAAAQAAAALEPVFDPVLQEAEKLLGNIDETLDALVAIQAEDTKVPTSVAPDEARTAKINKVSDILTEIGTNINQVKEKIVQVDSAPVSQGISSNVLQKVKTTTEALVMCLANKKENPDLCFSPSPQSREDIGSADMATTEALQQEPEVELEAVADGPPAASDENFSAEISAENFEVEDFEEHLEFSGDDSAADSPADDSAEGDDEDFKEASQDDIDKLLAEMGS